jgi:GT2 family glycosyltransferase
VHVPDFLYSHRLHAQQTTETQNSKQIALTTQIQHEAQLRDAIRRGDYKRPISIIMLSYGKHTQTLQALQGLQKTVHIPYEIILYDNGSTSETVDFLKNRIDGQFPNVQVIYGDTNLGPAQGRRQALEYASGEWFLIFDNDEIPEPGWLEELLLRAESDPQVGAVCCRVTFPNGKLQFSGGKVEQANPLDPVIDLGLHDFGKAHDDLSTCGFREVDWCPIGATLFTVNIAPYLHDGYPNTFEDAGVSYALKKAGYRLLNAPGALVWHEHITFQPKVDMGKKYMADRYNPKMMLKSVASFYAENGLIIKDEYIWRENGLNTMNRQQLLDALKQAGQTKTSFH